MLNNTLKAILALGFAFSGAFAQADDDYETFRRRGPGRGYQNCYEVGWSATRNGTPRECVAGYRNDDNRFYNEARRYNLDNCYIHRDGSGDRFYFCDLGGGWDDRPGNDCTDFGWQATRNGTPRQCVAGYRNDDNRFYSEARRYNLKNCYIHRDGSGDHFYFCDLDGGWDRPGTDCTDFGWQGTRNGTPRECVAGYRNDDNRFYDEQRRYRLNNCYIHRDGSGDHFYFCDRPYGRGRR